VAGSFVRHLEAAARRAPNNTALRWNGGALTHAELQRRGDAFAERLRERGVSAGDRIAVAIGNRWTFAVALLGGWKLGATVAPIDPLLKSDERAPILSDLAPTLLVESSDVAPDDTGLPAGAQPQRGSARVPRGPATPATRAHRPRRRGKL
jgi:acyl-CoA synthetase (AMP-forming)/AMP-acid ligase II